MLVRAFAVVADSRRADKTIRLPGSDQPRELAGQFLPARKKNFLLGVGPTLVEQVLAREVDDRVRLLHTACEAGVRPVERSDAGRRAAADGEHLVAGRDELFREM